MIKEKIERWEITMWNDGNTLRKAYKGVDVLFNVVEAFARYSDIKNDYDHVSLDMIVEQRFTLVNNNIYDVMGDAENDF